MTLALILNIVFAVAVVGGMLRLLSWAIVSSRPDAPVVVRERRHLAPHPYGPRPQSSRSDGESAHAARARAGAPVGA